MQTRHLQSAVPIRSNHRAAARDTGRDTAQQTARETSQRAVELVLGMPQARQASVVGSFNNWDLKKTPMTKDLAAGWKATLALQPGRYEYRFVVDGQWISDPNAKETVSNPFGGTNSVLVV